MLIYTAGPYGHKTAINGVGNGIVSAVDENIATARRIAIQLWEMGHAVICPHLNTAHFERDCKCLHEDYMRGDLIMVERVDAVVMLPGWEDSKGAQMEYAHAVLHDKPVYQYPDLPEPIYA